MQNLTKEELLLELRRRPGLVPIEIEVRAQRLRWMDLEAYHFYEGFFHRGLENLAAQQQARTGNPLERFETDLDVLHDPEIIVDSIYPTGFIFHAGRCGSTLLTRILARDRRHLVIGEAAAHNQVWMALSNKANHAPALAERQEAYRHLVLAMGRQRIAEHEAYFIKFTSFNILFFDFIRSVFPDVPAIFLYRKPLEVVASYAKDPPGWLHSSQTDLKLLLASAVASGSEIEDAFTSPANAVTTLFAAGLGAGDNGIRYLNYADLTPDNLPTILRTLNAGATAKQLATMQSQFKFDFKVDDRATDFVARVRLANLRSIDEPSTERLRMLYDQLVESDLNVM
jgi:hypothetical protein